MGRADFFQLERYTHALNVTHKKEMSVSSPLRFINQERVDESSNEIYENMLTQLSKQDDLLSAMYQQLVTLDKEVQASIEVFVGSLEKKMGEVEGVGKGCRATIVNAVAGQWVTYCGKCPC